MLGTFQWENLLQIKLGSSIRFQEKPIDAYGDSSYSMHGNQKTDAN